MQSVSRGVTDIGVMAPPASHGFFSKCGFGPDRQDLGSQAMAFLPSVWLASPSGPALACEQGPHTQSSATGAEFDPDANMLRPGVADSLQMALDHHSFKSCRPGEVWQHPGRQPAVPS